MCGIVGYIGERQAQPILFHCLARLEYRGYDSCGIALAGDSITVYKDAVRIGELAKVAPKLDGTVGIGHNRWATHGGPSKINAQISHLVEKYYQGNLEKAVETALRDVEGSYAVIVQTVDEPKLVIARKDSPLIIGIGDGDNFIASDVPAILDYTNRVIYLEDGDIGVVTADNIEVTREGKVVSRKKHQILWSAEQAQKGGYEHFMLKEIHEQPKVIRDTFAEYAHTVEPIVDLARIRDGGTESILILACGTSYHAALLGKYVIEELLRIPVRVEIASEFNYYLHSPTVPVSIAITQSGETADTLKAMKRLKQAGCRVIAITNVVDSTASRIADQTIYTRAGPEISVAATKSFMAQLIVLYWLAMSQSSADIRRSAELLAEMRQLPEKVTQVLNNEGAIAESARYLSKYENIFFIGRGMNYAIAMEGALKLKEISYIHAEAYAAGEIKHGPFALLGSNTPVIAIVCQDNTYEAVLTNIKEITARDSPVIALAQEGDEAIEKIVDSVITLPRTDAMFSPVVNTVALQLLAYYAAKERGCSIDFPRNLAKSVTVE